MENPTIRCEPREITISTTRWREVIRAISDCEQQFTSCEVEKQFFYGEGHAYWKGLCSLRTKIIPTLQEKIGKRRVQIEFSCSPKTYGSVKMVVTVSGFLVIKIYDYFYDTFKPIPGFHVGNVDKYVQSQTDVALRRLSNLKTCQE